MDFEYRKTVQILLLICLVFQQSSTIDSPPKGLEKEENESLSFSNCSTTTTADPSSCRCSDNLCLSEECILAASTVLSSLDRTADPCEDFYQFACGGWIQKSVSSNTDRFNLVDKRNQKSIQRILESTKEDDPPAYLKAKDFYQSCLNETEEMELINKRDMLAIIEDAGGCQITGNYDSSLSFDWRVQKLQNQLGVDVFFTWGVIEKEGRNHLALIAGGWNDALVVDEYLELMSTYTSMLIQAEQESLEVNLDLGDMEDENLEPTNTTISLYEEEYNDIIDLENYNDDPNLEDDPEAVSKQEVLPSIILNALANMSQIQDKSIDKPLFAGLTGLNGLNDINLNDLNNLLLRHQELRKYLSDVIKLEEAMSNITNLTSTGIDINKLKPFKVSQLAKEMPFLNWTAFFQSAFTSETLEDPTIVFDDIEVLIQEDYVRGIHQLIESYKNSDQSAVLVNYMMWRFIYYFYPSPYRDANEKRESCLKQTESAFPPVITSMYIKSKGIDKSQHAMDQVTMMVQSMQEAFRQNLDFIPWMSRDSAEAAKAKLEHMADLIGYPTFVLNDTWLNQVFDDIVIHQNRYVKNEVSNRSFQRKLELRDFFQNPVRGAWKDFSTMANIANVNAYYNQATNTMVVPIGMLQPPLFWSRPKSLTFGAFGIVVAHEITHAFDEVGIMYNSKGQFQPLYDNETITAFHNASDCIRTQYSNFSIHGVNVDGNVTLGENIADHGGLKIAEIAYENWLKLNGNSDATLPALEAFSPFQLFYLGYALPWCAIHTESMLKNHVMRDEHAPDNFRVRGPLSNSPRFAETWGCPLNSAMNPEEKCQIWGHKNLP